MDAKTKAELKRQAAEAARLAESVAKELEKAAQAGAVGVLWAAKAGHVAGIVHAPDTMHRTPCTGHHVCGGRSGGRRPCSPLQLGHVTIGPRDHLSFVT